MSTQTRVVFSSLFAVAALVIAGAQGCSLLTKADRSLIEGTGGAGGAGATSAGGSGATTTTGGTGTGGTPCATECCAPSDCPSPASECVSRTCEGGVCGTKPVSEDVPVSEQTTGDCRQIVCDGAGATKSIANDDDLPDDGKACTTDTCQNGVPKNTPSPAGETCDEDGGHKCDGSGACLECLAPSDCTSKVCTVAGACAPASCGDGVKNADETDTDCGGSCGATCDAGDACKTAADCIDKVCTGAPLKCAAATCSDGIENGDETDIDCGGALCGATCGPFDGCLENGDCKGDACTGSFCLESCTDEVKNNGETGLDCGGPTCTATCATGTPCVVPSDCTSAFCVDGVCCGTACDAECSACAAAVKGSGADGECGPVAQGTDPHGDCDVQASTTCGNSTGTCDGAAKCEKFPANTACGDTAACTNGTQVNPDACDGAGTCIDAGTVPCGLYACGAVVCKSTCAGDADCAPDAYCLNTACVAKKAIASTCGGANECASGSCADGRCCDTACDGLCVACSVAAGGAVNGTCGPVPALQDPANDCGANGKCDGAGGCKKVNGQTCLLPSECLSASCADGFCCNTLCVGLCQACSNLKKGSGANGSCGVIGTGLDPDEECGGVTTCNGAGDCNFLPIGATCAINGECASNHCADGLCCTTACDGFCQACTSAKTGSPNGTCADITPGTDPDDECPDPATCAGNFSCTP